MIVAKFRAKTKDKLNSNVKKIWIKALRSGRYKQCQESLCKVHHKKASYCCLGVLCQVLKNQGMPIKKDSEGYTYQEETDEGNVPVALRKTIGLSTKMHSKLVEMNDDDGSNFQQIADYIEEKL